MKAVNLMSLGDYPEDFIDMKRDIEEKQLRDGVITDRYKFPDFLAKIAAGCVYKQGDTIIPFTISEGAADKYLVYTLDENDDALSFNKMIDKLKLVKFNTQNFKELTADELLHIDLSKDTVFIINGKYCR